MNELSPIFELLTDILENTKKIERKIERIEKEIEKIENLEKGIEMITTFMGKINIKKSKIKERSCVYDDSGKLFMPSIRNQYGLPDFQKQFEEMKKAVKNKDKALLIKEKEEDKQDESA